MVHKLMERPIKGSASGKYNLDFVDPTNDICAYYSGMTELQHLVENYLETVTYHRVPQPVHTGASRLFSKELGKGTFAESCSVCLSGFREGEEVKVLPCRHCFHRECVMPWFESNSCCPNCRQQLPIHK